MKRSFKVLPAAMALAMLVTACAAPAAPAAPAATAAPAASGETAPAEQPAAQPPVTVSYTYPGTVFKDVKLVEEELNKLITPKTGITLKLNPIDWGAYDEKMKLSFAAGEDCDIVFTAPWINNYIQNIANGNLVALDDLFEKNAPGLWASMPATTWDAARVNGKIYGVINQQIFVKPFGFTVRNDLAEKYNLDITKITKYEELEPFIKAVKEGEPDVTPLQSSYNWMFETAGFDPIVSQEVPVAIRFDDKEMKVFNAAATPEFKASVELARKWYDAGYTPKDKIEAC